MATSYFDRAVYVQNVHVIDEALPLKEPAPLRAESIHDGRPVYAAC